jgi:DNA-binding XRE family transcriptional regulator
VALPVACASAADWGAQLRRFRRLHALKQAALAAILGIDQATISRWECGVTTPDLANQCRLRELLRRVSVKDAWLKHAVVSAVGQVVLSTPSRVIVAASPSYHAAHGMPFGALVGQSSDPTHTAESKELWWLSYNSGFYRGDVASVSTVSHGNAFAGDRRNIPVRVLWTPIRLTEGEIILRGERVELAETEFPAALANNGGPIRIVTLEDLIR